MMSKHEDKAQKLIELKQKQIEDLSQKQILHDEKVKTLEKKIEEAKKKQEQDNEKIVLKQYQDEEKLQLKLNDQNILNAQKKEKQEKER